MLEVSASATVDLSIAALLSVFAEPALNLKWNERLSEQTLLHAGNRTVAHQLYPMPWPLTDRDFVLTCDERVDERSRSFFSSCSSTSHPAFPSQEPGVVRAELVRSSWSFTAVPGSESTHVTFSSAVDPKGAIPRPLVAAAQRLGRDQLISALVEEARGRTPSPRFEHWAAAADAQGQAGHSTPNRASWPSAALVRTARGVVAVVRGVATAATARCLAAGNAAANATTAARAEAVLAAARGCGSGCDLRSPVVSCRRQRERGSGCGSGCGGCLVRCGRHLAWVGMGREKRVGSRDTCRSRPVYKPQLLE